MRLAPIPFIGFGALRWTRPAAPSLLFPKCPVPERASGDAGAFEEDNGAGHRAAPLPALRGDHRRVVLARGNRFEPIAPSLPPSSRWQDDPSESARAYVNTHQGHSSMEFASAPFKVLGALAIIAAGLIAAAIAYHPTKPIVWMVAYLVLVVGVVQYVLGTAQASLSARELPPAMIWGQWVLLNLGHAGVIAGTLATSLTLLLGGTVLYDLAMIWMGLSVRNGKSGLVRIGYWLLVLAMLGSSFTGVMLTLRGD
jgi:hypothetical protein